MAVTREIRLEVQSQMKDAGSALRMTGDNLGDRV
jgi:hypothetical protein